MLSRLLPTIYLDFAAGTPVSDELLERHRRYHRDFVVNPHGGSCYAEYCRRAIINAEERLLACIGTNPDEAAVIWTSGGTEALNLAIQGFTCGPEQEIHCETGAHEAMLEPFKARLRRGQPGRILPLTPQGQVVLDLQHPPALLALSHVNNETGAIQDLAACRHQVYGKNTTLLVDAAQSLGKCPIPWQAAGIDLLAISARKIGGPPAVGALVVRRDHVLTPMILGGGQQRGMRSGTVDTIGVVLFADAAKIASAAILEQRRQHQTLSRRLLDGLQRLGRYRCRVLSPPTAAPHITMIAFEGYEGAVLMRLLAQQEQILVGTGSACSAESNSISHVLKAMAVPDKLARGAIRISLGPSTTVRDIDALLAALERVLARY